jgi:hypothetical protein
LETNFNKAQDIEMHADSRTAAASC